MTCLSCTAEVTNGLALCDKCQQTLRVALVNTAAYYADAERIQPGQRVKVRGAYQSTPPPAVAVRVDPISATTARVDALVIGWVRTLEDDRPGIDRPPRTVPLACGWLEHHVPTIATLEWAGEILREMRDCERWLQRLIDQSDTGWYAGACGNELGREEVDGDVVAIECPRQLYGTEASAWVTCPECGRVWDADARREKMMADARDRTVPVRVLAQVVVGLTDEPSVEKLIRRIEKWVEKGTLIKAGSKVYGKRVRAVYRIGDVFDMVKGDRKPKDDAA